MRCRVATVVLLAAALTGCTGEPAPTPGLVPASEGPAASNPAVPSAAPTEGSAATAAGRTHTWPSGITATLLKVEKLNSRLGSGLKPGQTLVKVTFGFGNTTAAAVPFDESTHGIDVFHGSNRTVANQDPGFMTDNPAEALQNLDRPTRIAAGGKVTLWRAFDIPNAELGQLFVEMDPPQPAGDEGLAESFTFTEVEKMLQG